MAVKSLPAGPFIAAYVDISTNSAPLTLINSIATEPVEIQVFMNSEYKACIDNDRQTGLYTVKFDLNFYGHDDIPILLARRLSLSAGINDAISNNKYSLLLLHNNDTEKASYYFPTIRAVVDYTINYDKSNPTKVKISFIAENRDSSADLYFRNTYSALDTEMGSKSPI